MLRDSKSSWWLRCISKNGGIDYHDMFSPVATIVTLQHVLGVAALYNWPLHQMNVTNAFLQGNLVEEIFMSLPEGFGRQGRSRYVVYSNPCMD